MEYDLRWLMLCTFLLLAVNSDSLHFAQASECRVTFFSAKLQPNMALLNHVIKEHEVDNDQMCRVKCYLNHDCVSYNLGPSQSPGMLACQLNNADRYQYPQDYQDKPGYSYRGTKNKCAENPCLANQTCQTGFNTEGYRCLCPEGFTGEKCEIDTDECSTDTHNCSSNATCINTVASFECVCKPGFIGNGLTCTDIDECSLGHHNCSVKASCSNKLGSFNCACNLGFQGDGCKCEDIDECSTNIHNCSSNATCINKVASFDCECKSGFVGDGLNCTDINECSLDLHNCSVKAYCSNILGSFNCACNLGFQGDGYKCEDVNECSRTPSVCSVNATCHNSFGSHVCACVSGFEGDGISCREKWIKAIYSGPTVCVGAKDASFGEFAVPFTGKVKHFKLVHVSGGVAWGGGSTYQGPWGDTDTKDFELHITNVSNDRIAPQDSYPLTKKESLRYRLPGQDYMDPQLLFPEFLPFFTVKKNQMFRIWFGEDLTNYYESDNSGKTCSNVYIMYTEYEQ